MSDGPFIIVQTLTKLSEEQRKQLSETGVFAVDAKIFTEFPPGKIVRMNVVGYVMPADAVDKAVSAENVLEIKPQPKLGAPFDEAATVGYPVGPTDS